MTFEDLRSRTVESLSSAAADDLLGVFDVSELGNHPVKKLTVSALAASLAGTASYRGRVTVAADYTVLSTDSVVLVDSTSDDVDVTLPSPVSGRVVTVKKVSVDGNTVTAIGNTIDGTENYSFTTAQSSITVIADGTNWHIISAYLE